jgi:EpsD family peptidyl-prolyl cis-trans isomerase
MRVNIITIFILGLLYLASCSNAQQEGKVIAEVNGSKLTYEYLLDQFPAEYRSSINKDQLQKAIDAWIETELLYQEALKHKIDKDPSIKNMLEQKRKDIIAARFVDISIPDNMDITDAVIDSVYQDNEDLFVAQEDMFKLRHIVLSSKSGAEAVYNRLKKGDSFISLVADYSEDEQTRKQDGELGYLTSSALEDNMVSALKAINIGQYTAPIKGQSGYYHIFLLEDRKTAGDKLPLDDIRGEIAETIKANRQQTTYKELVNRLTGAADIKRYPLNDIKK